MSCKSHRAVKLVPSFPMGLYLYIQSIESILIKFQWLIQDDSWLCEMDYCFFFRPITIDVNQQSDRIHIDRYVSIIRISPVVAAISNEWITHVPSSATCQSRQQKKKRLQLAAATCRTNRTNLESRDVYIVYVIKCCPPPSRVFTCCVIAVAI